MATKPGRLTDWPWKHLGGFKYAILAPWVGGSMYNLLREKGENEERDIANIMIMPFLLWRVLHNQIWITVSRHRTAKTRIVDKSIEFDQVDREIIVLSPNNEDTNLPKVHATVVPGGTRVGPGAPTGLAGSRT
ncbi:hypothetical protein LguiA_008263 [Lonicera macranthoides]